MQSNEWSKRYSSIYAKCEDFENCVVQHTTPFFSKNVSWRGGYRRFSSVFKSKNVVRILICFIATSLLLWGIVWYRSVRPQQKSALQGARDFKALCLITCGYWKPHPWDWGRDLCGNITCFTTRVWLSVNKCWHAPSLNLLVCSLRGSRQKNKNGSRQTPPKWR